MSLIMTSITAAVLDGVAAIARRGGRRVGRALGVVIRHVVARLPGGRDRAPRLARNAALFLASSGARDAASALSRCVGGSPNQQLSLVAHDLLLRLGETGHAATCIEHTSPPVSPSTTRVLAARRATADPHERSALEMLGPAIDDDPAGRSLRLELLQARGRMEEVLEGIDVGLVSPLAAARYEFDARWELGDPNRALDVAERYLATESRSVDMLRRLREAHRYVGSEADALARLLDDSDDADWRSTVLLEFDEVDALIADAEGPSGTDALGRTARLNLARALYIARRFDEARALLRPLRGTGRRWDAEKLDARIELELDVSEATIDRRRERRRPGESFDEVVYFALHHLGRHGEAFATYLTDHDRRRLVEVFATKADLELEHGAEHRLILPQGGPGDEILLASTYRQLASRATKTTVAVEPRLAALMTRNFPELTFVPCARRASRPAPGFIAGTGNRRADNVLFDHLDQNVSNIADHCDRVAFGRTLTTLADDRPSYPSYLSARPDLAAAIAPRVRGGVGIVWRSEFHDAMRSIHYLSVDDLHHLAELDCPVVCLQHDATPHERERLRSSLGPAVVFLDDIDLRDDFESLAAVLVGCRAVAGVGTTTVELAGALGTPTVSLHPNHFGSWRRGPDGRDYWHDAVRVAVAPDPRRPAEVVAVAVDALRAQVFN